MPHRSLNVYRFLIFLEKYLLGDLDLFHQIANDAEKRENKIIRNSQNKGCINFIISKLPPSIQITTTKYPYSFEFMFGATVISRLTIPNAGVLFSTIDVLGFFTRTGSDFASTTKNFTEFFSYPNTTISTDELNVLINIYRHGITHNYFPKLNVEISYHSSNPKGMLFFKKSPQVLVLNVNRLEELVVDRLKEIISDSSLFPNMDSQLTVMTTYYQTHASVSIANLLARL